MSEDTSLSRLFNLAIKLEHSAKRLYQELALLFADYPDLVEFWGNYAQEEAKHAGGLARIRAGIPQALLDAPADPNILNKAYKMSQFSLEDALGQIRNLEDAYQLATELENSETNAIFDFLVTNYSQDAGSLAFARAQLTDHIEHLKNDLPPRYHAPAIRKTILVRRE